MNFRSKFKTKEREEGMEPLDSYVRGETSENPLFMEQNSAESLEATESEARAKTVALPNNAFVRQPWLYHASVARDAAYSRQRRTSIKAAGLGGLYIENYGGAKIAHDSKHTS